MAPAEGAPDEAIVANPEQPSGTDLQIAELTRLVMASNEERRDSEKRLYAAFQSQTTVTEAGKLARVKPGKCYSSPLF